MTEGPTCYLTEPVHPDAGPDTQQDILLDECWLHCQDVDSSAARQRGFSTLRKLQLVPYGLYLNFERGREIAPCVLAWRQAPEVDLASFEDTGYELHAVVSQGHRLMDPPALVADFHAPIAAFAETLAAKADQHLESTAFESQAERIATQEKLLEQLARQLVEVILQRIQDHMVLRAAVLDEDGNLLGYGPDLAPGLVEAWRAYLNR